MAISFLGALGHGGSGFVQGMEDYERRQQMQMRNEQTGRDLDSQTAYGNALTGNVAQQERPNSIWQRLAGLFQAGQEQARDPLGATALPEGVQPVQQTNMFDDVRGMARQEMGMPPAPPMQPMPQGAPQQPQFSMPQMQPGSMSLQAIAQRVAAANPGAPPHVIAGAIDRFRPWMTQEAQLAWRQAQLELREAQLQRQIGNDQQRGMQTDRRLDQGGERLRQQGTTQQRRLEQGDRRLGIQEEQGNRRLGIQEEQGNRRLQTGETNAETRRRGQENTAQYREQRLGQINQQIEQRRQQMTDVNARFEQRMASARTEQERRAAMREYEQAWKQYNDTTGRMIQADRDLTSAQKAKMLPELAREREQALSRLGQYRQQPSTVKTPVGNTSLQAPGSTPQTIEEEATQGALERSQAVQGGRREAAGGKNPMRAEPQQAPAGPPPAALQALKEGVVTTFANGQKWTLQNGKPVQVQ